MTDREYGIADPTLAMSMSGIEFLRAMQAGELPRPPIGQRMPMELEEVLKGKIVLTALADDSFLNPAGIVHGGLALTALDTAMGLATLSMLPAGKGYSSMDTAVRFLRPMRGGTEHQLTIIGEVVSLGKTVATVTGEMRNDIGKLVATGTSSCAIFDHRSSPA